MQSPDGWVTAPGTKDGTTVQILKPSGGTEGSPAQWKLSWVWPHACPAAFGGQGDSGLHARHEGPAPTEPTGKGVSVGP